MENQRINWTAILLGGMFCITILFIGLFIWPGMYEYDKMDQKWPVRINRLTGETEVLIPDGWVPLGKAGIDQQAQNDHANVPEEELQKIDLRLKYNEIMSAYNPNQVLVRELSGTLYNGTERMITELIVEVTTFNGDKIELSRRYVINTEARPYSDTTVSKPIELDLKNKKYQIKIVGARWK